MWVGNVDVRHESPLVNFQSFCLLGHREGVNRAWKGMRVTIVLELWNHKNKVVFKDGLVDADEIFSLAQLKGWLWLKFKMKRTLFPTRIGTCLRWCAYCLWPRISSYRVKWEERLDQAHTQQSRLPKFRRGYLLMYFLSGLVSRVVYICICFFVFYCCSQV